MRTLCLLLVAAGPAAADQYVAAVGPAPATLRSGPGDKMPDTGTLPAGTSVIVHHEDGDWLAVQPPAGALSWVRAKVVSGVDPAKPWPQNAVVDTAGEPVKLAAGRTGWGLPLEAERTGVPAGTVLTVVGPKVSPAEGGAWYPVVPPEDDFRYLPKAGVKADPGRRAGGRYVVRSPAPAEPPDRGAAVPASIGGSRAAGSLWDQAEAADRAGDADRAEALYLRCAGEAARPGGDSALPDRCYARVHALREKKRGGGGTKPAAPADDWTAPGRLRPSGLNFGGQTTFALVGGRGEVVCYAVAGPGVDLGRQVGNTVELFGRTAYPGDLRGTPLVTADRVRAAK